MFTELRKLRELMPLTSLTLLKSNRHKDRDMIGIGHVLCVICESCHTLVMQYIVDSHRLSATVCAHKSFATFLETVNHSVAHHHVIHVRIRHVIEVAAYYAR